VGSEGTKAGLSGKSDIEPLTFELFAFRFSFRALGSTYFPPGKAGNVIRGALGTIFHKLVCSPKCPRAKTCEQRVTCAYARLFESTGVRDGPSGFSDWPRPFVIRAAHLDGQRFLPQQHFYFDLMVFEMHDPALAYFAIRAQPHKGSHSASPGSYDAHCHAEPANNLEFARTALV
jgi:hypothetical protein